MDRRTVIALTVAGRCFERVADHAVNLADRSHLADAYAALENGEVGQLDAEARMVRKDGSSLWTSQLAVVVRDVER